MSILAVLEQLQGEWNPASFEALTAARALAGELREPCFAAVIGPDAAALASKVAGVERCYAVEHRLLVEYSADGYALALRQLVEQLKPRLTLFPHTYQTRDFLPKLAITLGRFPVSGATEFHAEGGAIRLTRQQFQGKLNAILRLAGDGPHFASVQPGAYRAEAVENAAAEVEIFTPQLEPAQIRTRTLGRFRESQRTVDLGAASCIVAVGRGIGEAGNIPLAEQLAKALGGELAASRPVCDSGWLPMERQVGSSGQTVAPRLYIALGISGAVQHMVGMRGSGTIVAVNKDPDAPIFEAAQYGIVGDVVEVIPAIIEALKQA